MDKKNEDTQSMVKQLLSREPEEEYLEEWRRILKTEKRKDEDVYQNSVIVFRLRDDWYALSTAYILQIQNIQPIHRIPHRTNEILLGIVNFNGQLALAISLHNLLKKKQTTSSAENSSQRLMVIKKEQEMWIFPVDEVFGFHYFNFDKIENLPVTITESSVNFLQGIIEFRQTKVGYLDAEFLFFCLKKEISY